MISLQGLLGIVLAVLLALSALLGGIYAYGLSRYEAGKKDGAAAVAASLDAQTQQQARDAEAARSAALLPGAALRLRETWCRDCTP